MHGEVYVVDDVSVAFAEAVADAWRARPNRGFSIALSGGETARRCYEFLATWRDSPVDWMATEIYWGDERCVPLDHPDSNYRLAADSLLTAVGGVHALFPMREEDGPDSYHLLLSSVGTIDLIHLGLGADAHTASLFPDSPALHADPGRLVVANEDPTGTHPYPRMTLTYAGIGRGSTVVVTVSGEEKAEAFDRVRRGVDVPASHIRAERVIWLVDEAASGIAP
ncbi:6-phosphogluconolactonase [Actinospongicola halichondriae]|uniref:6-phosphogluconolactonase n=1 Tax=Actinospongicola halichondriae TaxID=3236844 RepID=UPI003D51ABA2